MTVTYTPGREAVTVPVKIDFVEPLHILCYCFEGNLTHDDLIAARQTEAALFASLPVEEKLPVVVEMSALHTIDPNLFPHLREMHFVSNPRIERVYVVGANPYLRALATSLGIFTSPHEFRFFDTRDEALRDLEAPT